MGDAAVSQFVSVTGSTEEAAHFFLESAGGDVAAAIDQYFATGGQMDTPAAPDEGAEGGGAPQGYSYEAPPSPGERRASADPAVLLCW